MPEQEGNGQGEQEPYEFQSAFTAASEEQPTPDQPEQPPQTPPEIAAPEIPVEPAPPEPVASPEPPEPVALSDIAQAAQEAGIDVEGLSDTDIFSAMASRYEQIKPYADYGQQVAPYHDQFQKYVADQQQPQPEPEPGEEWTPETYFKQKWNEPAWNQEWDYAEQHGVVQRNPESGFYEPVQGRETMAMPIVDKMNQALMARQQQWQQITQGNPYQMFYEALLEPMQKAWQSDLNQAVEERLSSRDTESLVNDFEKQNAGWLYQKNDTGQQLMTEKGQAFYQTINELRDAGVNDPQTLLKLATRMHGPNSEQEGATPPPNTQTPTPAPEQPQASPEAVSATKQQSFLENALDRARHSPSAGGYTEASSDDPVNVNERELNNMFVNEAQKAAASGT